MESTNCKICGDPIGTGAEAKASTGRPRIYCRVCRPGGPNFRPGVSSGGRAIDEARFRSLIAAGKTAIEIARELGCTRQNIYALARKRGLTFNGPK